MMNRIPASFFLLFSLISFAGIADTNVLRNDVQLVFKGADPATQGLVFEGTSIGDYGAGTVKILTFPSKLVGTEFFLSSQWTFTDPSGASVSGANHSRLDLGSLDLRERGTVLTCFGGLSHLCGCEFRLEGFASDSEFVPQVTSVYARSSIFAAEHGNCLVKSDNDDDEEDDD